MRFRRKGERTLSGAAWVMAVADGRARTRTRAACARRSTAIPTATSWGWHGARHRARGLTAEADGTPTGSCQRAMSTEIVVDDKVAERYPDGTRIIPSDHPEFAALVQEAVADERPAAIVMLDGSDIVWRPRDPAAGWAAMLVLVGLLILKWEKRGSSTDRPLFVPEDWLAEFHRPPVAAETRAAPPRRAWPPSNERSACRGQRIGTNHPSRRRTQLAHLRRTLVVVTGGSESAGCRTPPGPVPASSRLPLHIRSARPKPPSTALWPRLSARADGRRPTGQSRRQLTPGGCSLRSHRRRPLPEGAELWPVLVLAIGWHTLASDPLRHPSAMVLLVLDPQQGDLRWVEEEDHRSPHYRP